MQEMKFFDSRGGSMTPRDRRLAAEKGVEVCEQKIHSWEEFHRFVFDLNRMEAHGWIYRGQTDDWPLKTSIERALLNWKIDFKEALQIEWQTIREFQRRTLDPLYERVHADTLFCLSVMQHYGAPTRLLDCSYSPFAAAAFAMEKGPKRDKSKGGKMVPVVWCFSVKWLRDQTKENTRHKDEFIARNADATRNDSTFRTLYQVGPEARTEQGDQFVKSENPLHLNERLTTQQGVFLCPGDLTVSFDENLKRMKGCNSKTNVVKLRLEMNQDEGVVFARNLKGMNLSFAALFPGLEGFARSISQQLFHYQDLAEKGAGQRDYLSSPAAKSAVNTKPEP
jgi:hypothetical protein